MIAGGSDEELVDELRRGGAGRALRAAARASTIGSSCGVGADPARRRRRHARAPPRRRAPVRAEGRPQRTSVSRQTGDALLQALEEREPDLRGHVDEVAELALASAAALGPRGRGARRASRAPPSCTTSARSRCPTRSCTSPGRSTRRSGASCASTRIVGDRILSAAPALDGGREARAREPRALRRRRLPGPARRRGDPARRAHRRRLRRLPRDDLGPPLPAGDVDARRRSRSCAAAPGTSSTRTSSTPSASWSPREQRFQAAAPARLLFHPEPPRGSQRHPTPAGA